MNDLEPEWEEDEDPADELRHRIREGYAYVTVSATIVALVVLWGALV